MRRFLWLSFACALLGITSFARAQQIDLAAGGSTLFSSRPTSASLAFPPPSERGGSYAGASGQILFDNRFGFNAEISARSRQGWYNGYQRYRPVFYDINAVYAPHLPHLPYLHDRANADLMAGVGGETLIYYNTYRNCPAGLVCPAFVNSNHLLLNVGADLRYYFWRHFFARPEARLYFIPHNVEFHSNTVLRLGVSIGYSFGR